MNIYDEIEILKESYDKLSASLSHKDARSFEELTRSIWPDRSAAHCVDQFTPLTVLYPILQTERFVGISRTEARKACVAHLCFLISAFGEDRMQDGQIPASDSTHRAVALIKSEGVKILREIKAYSEKNDVTEDIGFIDSMLKPRLNGMDEKSLAVLAPLKAHFGFIATSCLLLYSNCSRTELELSRDAFAKTTIALQYADDAADWREDLPIADDNLLLIRLRDLGLDAYGLPDSEFREVNVGHALLRHNSIEDAKEKALRYADEAIQIQNFLDCPSLVSQLNRFKEHVERSTPQITERIEQDVLVACLMSSTVSAAR